MGGLIHGGDIYAFAGQEVLDFSANINPLGLHPLVREAARQAVDACVHYPDPLCRELRSALAAWENVEESRIEFGNGAADVILRLVQAHRPKRALLPAPTFAEYENALALFDCEAERFMLREACGFRVCEEILQCITPALDMLFLCNPNNPTGLLMDPELMRKVVQRCAMCGVLVVVDECFLDLTDAAETQTLKPLLGEYENLVLLKAFTKLFAMPGMRLGYALSANTDLLERVRQCGQPWGVSVIAQRAGVAALGLRGYAEEARAVIATQRERMRSLLLGFGCKVYGGEANYLFFYTERAGLQEFLKERRILIRSCANYRGLNEGFWRIAVRGAEENDVLEAALEAFFGMQNKR